MYMYMIFILPAFDMSSCHAENSIHINQFNVCLFGHPKSNKAGY